jgi:hypothetical protein
MKIAGPILEISFSGAKISSSSFASIETDAWVFVGNRKEFDPCEITEEKFFANREQAIVGFLRLTGYDVEKVSVSSSGALEMKICDKDIIIYPVKTCMTFGMLLSKGKMGNIATKDLLKEKVFLIAEPITKASHPNTAFKREGRAKARPLIRTLGPGRIYSRP